MKQALFTAVLALSASSVLAQSASQAQRQFEAGQYQQVVEAATPDGDPALLFTAAQSSQKLGQAEQAIGAYGALAARDEGDPWHSIGLSGQQLMGEDVDGAMASARRAVEMAGNMAETHYQLGMVLAKAKNWSDAADEFDRVNELDPANAYAYYYGGLMHYRANRPDRMANRFERFLTLAPNAPERPEVTQIMRTIRGR
jgi:tetratricopeptide (TPR) repeat protein